MLSPHVPSSLSSAAPRRAWHWRPVARKHPFPFGRRSQIPGSLCPFGPFLRRARASHCRSVDRKHPFPFGRRSQIPGPLEFFGPLLHPAHSSVRRPVDRKHPFPGRSQILRSPEPFGPFLPPAHSQLRADSPRLVPSLRRFACRASLEVSPRGHLGPRALFQPPAFSLVSIAGLAAAPTRLQPAPANSLSVNW